MRAMRFMIGSGLIFLGMGAGVALADWLGDANNERTELLIKSTRIKTELLPSCKKRQDDYVKNACDAALNMLSARYLAAGLEDEFLVKSGLRPEYEQALSEQLMTTVVSKKTHADEVKEINRQAAAIKEAFKLKTDIIP